MPPLALDARGLGRIALTAASTSRSVCAALVNIASNWAGGRRKPRSRMAWWYAAKRFTSAFDALCQSVTGPVRKNGVTMEPTRLTVIPLKPAARRSARPSIFA